MYPSLHFFLLKNSFLQCNTTAYLKEGALELINVPFVMHNMRHTVHKPWQNIFLILSKAGVITETHWLQNGHQNVVLIYWSETAACSTVQYRTGNPEKQENPSVNHRGGLPTIHRSSHKSDEVRICKSAQCSCQGPGCCISTPSACQSSQWILRAIPARCIQISHYK